MGLYIEVQYRGDWWGEDPMTETRHETTGDLFRSLAGKDHRYPWEALGRCTGKVYIDIPGSPCMLCHKTRDEHEHNVTTNRLHVEVVEEGGTSEEGKVYPHGAVIPHGHYYQATAKAIGWVFVARKPYDDDKSKTWLCESWVTVHTAPDTVTRTPHYAALED